MEYTDAISAKEGKVFFTVSGKTFEVGEVIKLEAKVELATTEVNVLGKRMVGNKPGRITGSASVKLHFKQSALRDVMYSYKQTGVYPVIDIQGINHDPTVPNSRIVHNLRGCIFTGALLNSIDGETDDILYEESDVKFNDYVKV